MKKVVVIGGGASGLMAAISAAEAGAAVTVLEQNDRPGRKLLATGNGRCNLTNREMTMDHYHGDTALAEGIIQDWPEAWTLDFFREIGLPVMDRNGWVYPVVEQASAVLQLLLLKASELKIKIKTNEHVKGITVEQEGQERFLVGTDSWQYPADAVIIACGSPASSVQGSSDDGIRLAEDLGINCVPFRPSLVPLKVRHRALGSWAGTRVKASVTLSVDGRVTAKEQGEVQLADYGISGIPVFQISGAAVQAAADGRKVEVSLNFLPDQSLEEAADELEGKSEQFPGRSLQQLLTGVLPEKLIPVVLAEAFGKKKVPVITAMNNEDKSRCFHTLADKIHDFRVTVTGAASMRQAQVCQGGIPAAALTNDLEARSIPGVFCCGEAVNVDAECGGYNLQWAWSSGRVAGLAAAR